jgi:hypothetical protein
MKKNTAVFTGLLILSAGLFFTACKKETKNYNTNSLEISLNQGNSTELAATPQKWHITNKKICVLFGYDFNDPQVKEPLIELLKKNFGLAEDGGLIYPLVYPEDFKHGIRGYASDFASILASDDLDLAGIVLLGAPENTHTAIAKNQDKWEQEVPYPVIALFPQDDVLGIESTCDIVVDKGQMAGLTGEIAPEESDGQIYSEAPQVIVDTIKYILSLDGALPKNQTVQTHLKQILKDKQFHHYTDPETGLQSINHFVIN